MGVHRPVHYPSKTGAVPLCGTPFDREMALCGTFDAVDCMQCQQLIKEIGEKYLELNLDAALRQVEQNLGLREGSGMHQDKNGVDVPWARDFEEAAQAHPELQCAIDRWFCDVDGPGHPDPMEVWARVSCQVMKMMANLIADPGDALFTEEDIKPGPLRIKRTQHAWNGKVSKVHTLCGVESEALILTQAMRAEVDCVVCIALIEAGDWWGIEGFHKRRDIEVKRMHDESFGTSRRRAHIVYGQGQEFKPGYIDEQTGRTRFPDDEANDNDNPLSI